MNSVPSAGCVAWPDTRSVCAVSAAGSDDGARPARSRHFPRRHVGNQRFWTDSAQLHEVVNKIRPLHALSLGLKVDQNRLNLFRFLISNPFGTSGTRELLRQNAVVGVRAEVNDGRITRIGITSALCHSPVDNALAPGIGHRIDGAPNRDLKVGEILALLATFTDDQRATLRSWPTGTYDPRFNFDRQSTRSCCRPPTVWPTCRTRRTRRKDRFRTGTRMWQSRRCTGRVAFPIRASG